MVPVLVLVVMRRREWQGKKNAIVLMRKRDGGQTRCVKGRGGICVDEGEDAKKRGERELRKSVRGKAKEGDGRYLVWMDEWMGEEERREERGEKEDWV